jgi:tetratricopeptide (TPR) repeat protein
MASARVVTATVFSMLVQIAFLNSSNAQQKGKTPLQDATRLVAAGDSLLGGGKNGEAISAYEQSLTLLREQQRAGEVASVIKAIAKAHGRIARSRESWAPGYAAQTERKEIYFRITSIVRQSPDTLVVLISGGTVDGIAVGAKGEVSPVNTKEKKVRESWSLAKAEVVRAEPNVSTVVLTRAKDGPPVTDALVDDIIILPVMVPQKGARSIFFDLLALNIDFVDLSRDTLYHLRQILYDDSPELESDLFGIMASDVRETVAGLQPYLKENPSWADSLKGGLFAGQSLLQAMSQCTPSDIRAFLRFVKSFPAKYMGHTWKINETFGTWLINSTPPGDESLLDPLPLLRLQSRPEFKSFVSEYQGYVLDRGSIPAWNTYAESRVDAGKWEEAYRINGLAREVAGLLKSDSSMALALGSLGRIQSRQGKVDSSLLSYTRAIALAPTYPNVYWDRGRLYASQERYEEAIKDLQRFNELFPNAAAGYGSQGWYMILLGKFREARPVCAKACELDSSNVAWAVNLGHTYLLEGDSASARQWYLRSLRHLSSEKEFLDGPIADFALFEKKGWQADLVRYETKFMQAEYGAIYRHDIASLESWREGKDLLTRNMFDEAGESFMRASAAERKSREPRNMWIMVEAEYAGSAFRKAGRMARAAEAYELALAYSQRPNSEGTPQTYMRALSEIYAELGDRTKASNYEAQAIRLEAKVSAGEQSNKLYVLSIGIDAASGGDRRQARAGASSLAGAITETSRKIFEGSSIAVLLDSAATRDSLEAVLSSVAQGAKPGDTFILYFAGSTFADAAGFYLMPFSRSHSRTDSLARKDAISAWQIRTWLAKIQARNQLVIIDAPATSFIAEYVSRSAHEESYLEGTGRDLSILCPATVQTESGDQASGVFTQVLVDGLRGRAAQNARDTVITAKELDAYVTRALSQAGLEIQSYTRGKDFPLAFVQRGRTIGRDQTPPKVRIIEPAATRGPMPVADEKTLVVKGKAEAQGGIYQILVNDVEATVQPNGDFSAEIKLAVGDNLIRVQAMDTRDNVTIDTFYVKRENTVEAAAKKGGRQGHDYALFLATNDYDEWDHLTNPVVDARALAATLKEMYGFDTTVVVNPTLDSFWRSIRGFMKIEYSDEDQLFIFIAGHGMYDPLVKDGYLVVRDSKKQDESRITYLGYPMLRDFLDGMSCKHIFLVLDACFGGSFDKRDPLRSRGEGAMYEARPKEEIFREKLKFTSRLFMTSGGMNYVPDGEPGHHSPFASKLLAAFEDAGKSGGYLTFHKIIPYIEDAKSMPRYGDFGKNQNASDFFFDALQTVGAKRPVPGRSKFAVELGGGK